MGNAAQEPEVSDLCHCLNKMGAKISGIGTLIITIEGVKKLHGTDYFVCSDRIESATYLVAAAITGGSITVKKPEKRGPSVENQTVNKKNQKKIRINVEKAKKKA